MTSAYVLAGKLAAAAGRHSEAFAGYEARLKSYIGRKQQDAERLLGRWRRGRAWECSSAICGQKFLDTKRGEARGRDFADELELPDYRWTGHRELTRAE
jgi:hypothetical protein